ncbi:MAG: hypothetical protein H6595_11745 [Flavobacteriales bacterium]|nr:hypothetical protein [Flavobacteriales bacterium]MCB9194302.1 hypothetical protein [Flavobacteriales bacterium]
MHRYVPLIAVWSLGQVFPIQAQSPFILRQTPAQPLSTYFQRSIPLPNGELWWVFGTWESGTTPMLSRVHLRKMDGAGQVLATNDLLLPPMAPVWQIRNITVMPGGGVALVGSGGWQGMYLGFDPSGYLQTARTFDFGTSTTFDDVAPLDNGDGTIVGYSDSYAVQLRIDAQGNLLSAWSDRFGNDKGAHHLLRASDDGGMLVVGQELTPQGPVSLYAIKLDSAANVQWAERFDGPAATALDAVRLTNGGWAMVSLKQTGPTPLHAGPWLLMLDPLGQVTHQARFWPGPYEDSYGYASGLTENGNGHLLLTGQCNPGGTFLIDAGMSAVADTVRWLPQTGGTSGMHGTALANDDLLLNYLHYDSVLARNIPVLARWDPAALHPCGEHRDTLYTDTLAYTLTTGVVRTPISATTTDILAQVVHDTITWTSAAPCLNTAIAEPHVAHMNGSALFPNPADVWVWLSGTADAERMELIDPSGRTFGEWKSPVPDQLSVAHLSNGLYTLRIADHHRVQSLRLMVMH